MRRIGHNRWRVTIEQPGTDTVSALGEPSTPWESVGTFWARRYVKSGIEGLVQGQETAVTVTQWFLRNAVSMAVTPEMRLIWDNHIYDIREVIPTGPADSELMLVSTEVLSG
jgi:head-tail adaptor